MTTSQKYASRRSAWVMGLILLLTPAAALAQTYTVSPPPFLLAQTDSGSVINNACIWTYVAGTTNVATTYRDNTGTPNSNPIRSDPAGRFTAFLVVGNSYKFVYETACTPPAHGTTLRTADNISAVPTTAATVDVAGTAGETVNARSVVYLSDGSGGKTAGLWYNADATNAYSSAMPEIGMSTAACVAAAASGCAIRLAGVVSGFSSTPGLVLYTSATPGGTTSTPSLHARPVGSMVSTTDFALPAPRVSFEPWANQFRLSLATATPVSTADVTGASAVTVYLTPYLGNRIDLPDPAGSGWPVTIYSAQVSIAVPATTSTMYDVFAYDNAGVVTLEALAWTNDTTRATALVRLAGTYLTSGVWVKTGAPTRLYLGSFRTTTVSGQSEDSLTKRYLYNYYNRLPRPMARFESAGSWSYSIATIRPANGNAANQLDFVIGISEDQVEATARVQAQSNSLGQYWAVGIGLDSTSVFASGQHVMQQQAMVAGVIHPPTVGTYQGYPGIGRHVLTWLEVSTAAFTTTWQGVSNPGAFAGSATITAGITGTIRN